MDRRIILIIGALAAALGAFLLFATSQSNNNIGGVSPIAARVKLGDRTVTVRGPATRIDWSWLSNLISGIGGGGTGIGTIPNNVITGGGGGGNVAGPAPVAVPVPDDWAGQVATYTNQARAKQGLPPLVWNAKLGQIAQNFSVDMNRRQFMSHLDPDGRQPWDRARQQGYPSSFVGENLHWGAKTPQEVVNSWLASPGHRANIMNRQYRQVGVGIIFGTVNKWKGRFSNANNVPYWTQLFSN